jgi:hypothetical protein
MQGTRAQAPATPRCGQAAALAVAMLAIATPAQSATLTVDTTSDAMLSACTAAAGDCSLRGAITLANADGAEDTIAFALPTSDPGYVAASGHWRIATASALPAVDADLVIDGYTQPGASANTLTPEQGGTSALLRIELANAGAGNLVGLQVPGNNFSARLVVRGLAISGYAAQLELGGGAAHRIEGCFLGTTIDGMAAAPAGPAGTGTTGVRLRSGNTGASIIGGTTPAARNLIAALGNGIASFGVPDGLRIEGNLIGVDTTAAAALPIRDFGITLGNAFNTTIGGGTPAARNIIAGTGVGAISLSAGNGFAVAFSGTRVLGNRIGTDGSGTLALGSASLAGQAAVQVFAGSPCGLEIGGDGADDGNLIAAAAGPGVLVGNCARARTVGNRFVANRGIAIDLATGSFGDGPTTDDPGDPDDGGNRLQNRPQALGAAPVGGDQFTLSYRVDTAVANASYPLRVDFHRGRGSDVLERVGSQSIAAIDAGTPRTVTLPLAALVDGVIWMSATDSAGNTSEFGRYAIDALFADGYE